MLLHVFIHLYDPLELLLRGYHRFLKLFTGFTDLAYHLVKVVQVGKGRLLGDSIEAIARKG